MLRGVTTRMSELARQTENPPSRFKLIPTLGIFSAVMLVAGGVIGSGIFRKAGVMAAQVGSPEVLLAVWLLAGVISLLGALSNAELSAMMPQTGGQYVYLQRAYGPFVAFLYGWALFAVIQSGVCVLTRYIPEPVAITGITVGVKARVQYHYGIL